MEKDILNIAIIGCGRVAGHHARSIDKIPGKARLVAVCDLVEERANELASAHDVLAYQNYHQMLSAHPEIDVVAIVTPSGMHFEHALDIIETYKKSVVVEKPLVMRISHGMQLAEAAAKNAVRVFPVFQYRFNKSVNRVKSAIQSGELGDIFLATVRTRWCRPQRYYDRDPWRGTFSHDGGACTNQGIHHLDLLRYLAGEVKRVNASMSTYGVDVEVEDTVVALLEFESGASGVLEITTAARPDDYESSISLLGRKGMAMIGGWATNDLAAFSPDPGQEKLNSEVFPDVYGFGHEQIYLGVCDTIFKNGRPAVEFEDAMKTMQLHQCIYASAEVENWVSISEGRESARLGLPDDNISSLYRTKKVPSKKL